MYPLSGTLAHVYSLFDEKYSYFGYNMRKKPAGMILLPGADHRFERRNGRFFANRDLVRRPVAGLRLISGQRAMIWRGLDARGRQHLFSSYTGKEDDPAYEF